MEEKNKRNKYLKIRVSEEELNAIKKKFQKRSSPHKVNNLASMLTFLKIFQQTKMDKQKLILFIIMVFVHLIVWREFVYEKKRMI